MNSKSIAQVIATTKMYRKNSFRLRISTYSSLSVDAKQLFDVWPLGTAKEGDLCVAVLREPRSVETRKSGKNEVREVVETKDGDLDWLISVNGKPLPEDQRSERQRGLQRLINNPPELKRSQREKDEDQVRSLRLLKTLPDALVFEYGEQRGELIELKFKPNPHFRPPSHEAAVVHAMEGVLWVSEKQKRLAEISGRLTRPVKFGGGLLGHLDAGGHLYVKQDEVEPGYWELTVLDVDMKGKALFFKTIGVQEEMKRSMFRRVRWRFHQQSPSAACRLSEPLPSISPPESLRAGAGFECYASHCRTLAGQRRVQRGARRPSPLFPGRRHLAVPAARDDRQCRLAGVVLHRQGRHSRRYQGHQGLAVEGAALHIGEHVVYTDSSGHFQLRFSKHGPYSLSVASDEFLSNATYEVVSAPAAARAEEDGAANDIEITLRHKNPSR